MPRLKDGKVESLRARGSQLEANRISRAFGRHEITPVAEFQAYFGASYESESQAGALIGWSSIIHKYGAQ